MESTQLTLWQYESWLAVEAKARPTAEEITMANAYRDSKGCRSERPISKVRRDCELHRKAYNKIREYRRCKTFELYIKELARSKTRQRKQLQLRKDWVTPTAIAKETDVNKAYWMTRVRRKQMSLPVTLFSLTADYLMQLHAETPVCPVFGTPLLLDKDTQIDQIIAGKGYHKGNVQLLSALANRMKNNATPEQLKTFARWVLSQGCPT
jgi:hypothetical protein